MATQYDPILKDSTGQAIVTKLEGIKNAINPTAENIPITTIEGMEAENVQSGLEELKGTLTYSKLFTSNHIILETNGGCVHLFTISIEPYSNIYNTVIIGNTYADYRPKYDIMQPAIIRHNGTYEACMARLTTDGKIVCSDSGGNTITNTTNFDYIVFSFAYAKK